MLCYVMLCYVMSISIIIVSLHLLLFLYVMILFCGTSKQYDIQYNRKRIEEEQAQKNYDPQLPIFISDFTEKQAQSRFS